jgi:glucose 1-dehydrogenase
LHYDSATKIPLHRTAVPGDFAGVAAFLLSEDAAFINGAEIRVDGGHLLYYGDR